MLSRPLLACLDVAYAQHGARAACVGFRDWTDPAPSLETCVDVAKVEPYVSGRFYLRELPCLLAVLQSVPRAPEVIIVDGYVHLPSGEEGLGAHLHRALGEKSAVVGVAKRDFRGPHRPVEIFRGTSRRPLYVTAMGLEVSIAAASVGRMHGPHRIPTLLRHVDALARSGGGVTAPRVAT